MKAVLNCFLLIVLLFVLNPLSAWAQNCPADTEQKIFDMQLAIEQGRVTESKPVDTLFKWAIENCPDRSVVQGQATQLGYLLIHSAQTVEAQYEAADLTYQAVINNGRSWSSKISPTIVNKSDGTTTTLYPYSTATSVLTTAVLPVLVGRAVQGKVHPILSGAALENCPYPALSAGRLEKEAAFWTKIGAQDDEKIFDFAVTRLKSLKDACQDKELAIPLAEELMKIHADSSDRYERLSETGMALLDPKTHVSAKKHYLAMTKQRAMEALPYIDAFLQLNTQSTSRENDQYYRLKDRLKSKAED